MMVSWFPRFKSGDFYVADRGQKIAKKYYEMLKPRETVDTKPYQQQLFFSVILEQFLISPFLMKVSAFQNG